MIHDSELFPIIKQKLNKQHSFDFIHNDNCYYLYRDLAKDVPELNLTGNILEDDPRMLIDLFQRYNEYSFSLRSEEQLESFILNNRTKIQVAFVKKHTMSLLNDYLYQRFYEFFDFDLDNAICPLFKNKIAQKAVRNKQIYNHERVSFQPSRECYLIDDDYQLVKSCRLEDLTFEDIKKHHFLLEKKLFTNSWTYFDNDGLSTFLFWHHKKDEFDEDNVDFNAIFKNNPEIVKNATFDPVLTLTYSQIKKYFKDKDIYDMIYITLKEAGTYLEPVLKRNVVDNGYISISDINFILEEYEIDYKIEKSEIEELFNCYNLKVQVNDEPSFLEMTNKCVRLQ